MRNIGPKLMFFSCPQDSFIIDLLTHNYSLLKSTTIQHSERLVTLETCEETKTKTMTKTNTMTNILICPAM